MKEITERNEETMILWKDVFAKIPEKANKMKYVSSIIFPFKCARGPGEKKKHKMRKRNNKEKNHNNKNNQTRYMQRSRK